MLVTEGLINDEPRHHITSACVGCPGLRVASDQIVTHLTPDYRKECTPKPLYHQNGVIFKGIPYEAFGNCQHNMVLAVIQRQTKTKGYAECAFVKKFVEYSKTKIRDWYHRIPMPNY